MPNEWLATRGVREEEEEVAEGAGRLRARFEAGQSGRPYEPETG